MDKRTEILDEIQAGIRSLRERLEELERRVEDLGAPDGQGLRQDSAEPEAEDAPVDWSEIAVPTPEPELVPDAESAPAHESEPVPATEPAPKAEPAPAVETVPEVEAGDESVQETAEAPAETVETETSAEADAAEVSAETVPEVQEEAVPESAQSPESASEPESAPEFAPAPTQESESAPEPQKHYAWQSDLPGVPVKNIRSAISLYDRALFINTLFREDNVLYDKTINDLNAAGSIAEAEEYVMKHFPDWNFGSEVVYCFMMAVRKKLG